MGSQEGTRSDREGLDASKLILATFSRNRLCLGGDVFK